MNYFIVKSLSTLILGSIVVSVGGAKGSEAGGFLKASPIVFAETAISLITINKGTELFSVAGHSSLRIKNSSMGLDYIFTWGNLDHSDPLFPFKFLVGRLEDRLLGLPTKEYLQPYIGKKLRIWDDRIHFDLEEKQLIISRLNDWENHPFSQGYYHFFKRNCSTRWRDLIDEVFGGRLKKRLENLSTKETLRSSISEILYENSAVWLLTSSVIGTQGDRRLNAWNLMYLPLKLRGYLLSLPGVIVLSTKVLDFPNLNPDFGVHFSLWFLLFLAVVILSIIYRVTLSRSRFQLPQLKLLTASFLLVAGFLGTFIWLLIFVAFYEEAGFNPLSWVINPSYLVAAFLLWPRKN